MDKLQVTAYVEGPIIRSGGYWTLDALLAAAVFDSTGDLDRAHNALPLANTGGMYHASAAFIEPRAQRRHAISQVLRPGMELAPWLKRNKHGRIHRKFDGYNILNSYQAMDAESVTWYCEGSADAIRALLERLPMIGKKRSADVTRWEVVDGGLDGVTGYEGEPIRPVPVALWKGAPGPVIADVNWRPAYWDPRGKAPCFVG